MSGAVSRYESWECRFTGCRWYDLVGSEHSCCRGGDKCERRGWGLLFVWGEAEEPG